MTVPHYGQRRANSLTAVDPGDTLYFAFASYNDSGDSEALTGLAVTDVEIFKNGSPTPRATDSGVSLISDTGMVGDRVGLYRIRLQLFNTADDATFFATGSWYQVAVDAVTIDGKTVRFWLGSFEIGEPRANVIQIDGDTGAADLLGKAFATTPAYLQQVNVMQLENDTGAADQLQKAYATTPSYFQQVDTRRLVGDTGAADQLQKAYATTPTYFQQVDVRRLGGDTGAANYLRLTFLNGFNDTGLNDSIGRIRSDTDTGIKSGVWQSSTRTLTANTNLSGLAVSVTAFSDTGVNDRLARILSDTDTGIKSGTWQSATRTLTANTNLAGLQVNVTQVDSDTGAADQLGKAFATTPIYFQQVDVRQLGGDTGASNQLRVAFANGFTDTGVNDRLARILSDTDTGIKSGVWQSATRTLTANTNLSGLNVSVTAFSDTGINDRLARILADTDTGIQGGVNLVTIRGDTGAADRFLKFAGSQLKTDGTFDTGTGQTTNTFNVTATAATDTGAVNNAVWNGVRSAHVIAGTFGESVNATAVMDTGQISNSVWNSVRSAHASAGTFGESVNASATVDTGLVANAIWNSERSAHTGAGTFGQYVTADMQYLDTDTGAANQLRVAFANGFNDTGINDRLGRIASDTDTGIKSGVWQSATRTLTSNTNLSGLSVSVTAFSDTGVNDRLAKILADTDTGIQSSVNVTGFADTGVNARLAVLTTGVNVSRIASDTGAADQLAKSFATTPTYFQQVDVRRLGGDTGAANYLRLTFLNGFSDTGINDSLGRIRSDTDTGIKSGVWQSTTRTLTANTNLSGLAVSVTAFSDTGINDRLARILADTDTGIQSSVNVTSFADTGVNQRLTALQSGVNITGISDTGINDRLSKIASDTDTGIKSGVWNSATRTLTANTNLAGLGVTITGFSDTGVNSRLSAIQNKTDSLTFTTGGQVDANIQSINDVTVTGAGTANNPWGS